MARREGWSGEKGQRKDSNANEKSDIRVCFDV